MNTLLDTYSVNTSNKSNSTNLALAFNSDFKLCSTKVALGKSLEQKVNAFLQSNSNDKNKKLLHYSIYDHGIDNVLLIQVDDSSLPFDRFASAGQKLRALNIESIAVYAWSDSKCNLFKSIEGLLLGTYIFQGYKKVKKTQIDFKHLDIVSDQDASDTEYKKSLADCLALVRGTFLTRDLVNEPANIVNPAKMQEVAEGLASEGKWSIDVLDQDQIVKKGMNLLNSVGMGSIIPPRMVHMSYKAKNAKKSIAIVGKGVTYDTGGYSLKPSSFMYGMKSDMGGAGTCYGIAQAINHIDVDVNIDIYTPLVENMVSDRATKPGDVFVGYNGVSVEIENTDAEGRLILADALSYACEKKPDYIIDMATLTGAVVIALGEDIFAAFTDDNDFYDQINSASEKTSEKVWRMPLQKSYKKLLKSDVADCKNVGGRSAGSITAALFLQQFVEKDIPWCHLDIAGVAFADRNSALLPKGGTGNPVRTLVAWLRSF